MRIYEEGMKRCVRIAAVILVVVGMASALAAQLSSPSSPHEKPAGCHEHGKTSPVRPPADYKCCVAGHHAALLRSAATASPVSQIGTTIPLASLLVTEIIGLSTLIEETPPNPSSRNVPLRV
jgi:hypothetical protein